MAFSVERVLVKIPYSLPAPQILARAREALFVEHALCRNRELGERSREDPLCSTRTLRGRV